MSAEVQGPYAVTAGYDLTVTITPAFKGQAPIKCNRITVTNSQINRICVTTDRKIVLATNPFVLIHDVFSSSVSRPAQYQGHQTNVTDIVCTDSALFSCSEDRTWCMWDRRQQQARPQKKISSSSALNSMALHPSQNVIFTANERGQVEMWDVAQGKTIAVKKICQLPVRSIALSKDGNKLVAGCHDGHVAILSVEESGLTEVHRFSAHDAELLKVELSPDNSCFVTTSADSTAKLWDFGNYNLRHVLSSPDQKKWIWDAAFTPDSQFVLTGGTDKSYRTWNCQSGQMVFSHDQSHQKGITAVAILA